MSYCRFSEADIYLFDHCRGGIECCACNMGPLIKTIFTTGGKLFGKEIPPCKNCGGEGCKKCMMHDSVQFYTRTEAINHVKKHIAKGDYVPDRVLKALQEELDELGEEEGLEPSTEE